MKSGDTIDQIDYNQIILNLDRQNQALKKNSDNLLNLNLNSRKEQMRKKLIKMLHVEMEDPETAQLRMLNSQKKKIVDQIIGIE